MPFTSDYNQEDDIIMLKVDGELDLPLLRAMATKASEIVKQAGCKHVINDLRNAKPTSSIADIYEMPDMAKQSGILQSCKRALVVAEETENFHFLETVFINQGHQVRIFTSMDEARAWLLGD